MKRAQEVLDAAIAVGACEGGASVGVDLESCEGAEGEKKDHDEAGLSGPLDKGGEIVNVSWSLDAEGGSESVNDGVVPDAPGARRGRAAHSNSAGERLWIAKRSAVAGDGGSAVDECVERRVEPLRKLPPREDVVEP